MRHFQYVMYGFQAVLFVAAVVIGIWFYRKRREDGQ